jgi:hypothetical protein
MTMPERKPVPDGAEFLQRISRLSSEAEWSTEELRDALREGGVDPDRLVRHVMTDVKPWLEVATEAPHSTRRPLIGALQQRTNLPPSAIAKALDVPVTFLSAVSRYPQVVPDRWRRELAGRAEGALQVDRHIVVALLTQPFQYDMAASRDTPYSTQAVESYEDILERSGMSLEARQYWRALAMDESA